MKLILSEKDLASLSPSARSEVLKRLGFDIDSRPERSPYVAPTMGPEYQGIDLEDVADLTFKQVQTWMSNASDKTKQGLRIIAQNGPVVAAQLLIDGGIDNIPHFQSRTTMRTRTVTGDKDAFLLGWDDWDEVERGEGKYAVTPITHQSLRRYFQLD